MLNQDKNYIYEAFKLAQKGMGHTSPNPLVGAILTKNNKIIGKGYHQKYGGLHAEVNAINSTNENLEGSTLYCNLEPCCHTNKQTPPCTKLIIEKKIKRVVVSNLDPNPEVNGKGLQILRDAGIEVTEGIEKSKGAYLNRTFFKYIKSSLPHVHLKIAQTLDGRISTSSGDAKWISDEQARTIGHQMRLEYDAIMIGRNTLNNDNPKLNIRMGIESQEKIPYRIVIGNFNQMHQSSYLLTDHVDKTIIISKNPPLPSLIEKGLKYIALNSEINPNPLLYVLKELGKMKISSILVEGGANLFSSFVTSKLYDQISFFIAPKLVGNGPVIYQNQQIKKMNQALCFDHVTYKQLDKQFIIEVQNQSY